MRNNRANKKAKRDGKYRATTLMPNLFYKNQHVQHAISDTVQRFDCEFGKDVWKFTR